jgi:hypothetical protein
MMSVLSPARQPTVGPGWLQHRMLHFLGQANVVVPAAGDTSCYCTCTNVCFSLLSYCIKAVKDRAVPAWFCITAFATLCSVTLHGTVYQVRVCGAHCLAVLSCSHWRSHQHVLGACTDNCSVISSNASASISCVCAGNISDGYYGQSRRCMAAVQASSCSQAQQAVCARTAANDVEVAVLVPLSNYLS